MLPQHIVASPCALVLLMNVGPGVSFQAGFSVMVHAVVLHHMAIIIVSNTE